MTSVYLTKNEKDAMPKLGLHKSANELNTFVKNTHRSLMRKEIEKKKEEKEKKKKAIKHFKEEFKKITTPRYVPIEKKETIEECTTRQLQRIVNFFKEDECRNKEIQLSDITLATALTHRQVNDGIKWLVRNDFIQEINERGRYFYKLKVHNENA